MTRTDSPHANRRVLIPALIAVVAALVALVAFITTRPADSAASSKSAGAESASTQQDDGTAQLRSVERRKSGDPLARGKLDAPVVMVEFSDFQCPYCGQFARTTESKLVDKYVKNGTLRIEWRDFPYLGEESYTAALAGRAAAEQGGFWKLHNVLYKKQSPPNSGKLSTDRIASLADSSDWTARSSGRR